MTESSAQKLANVVIGAAVVGAACYVARTPRLRRLAWRLALGALTGTVPAWLRQEVSQQWQESGRGRPARARTAIAEQSGKPATSNPERQRQFHAPGTGAQAAGTAAR